MRPDYADSVKARHGTVSWVWTPAPIGYRHRVWSRMPHHCGAQVPLPVEGWTPADPEWWVNAISALPYQLQRSLFDPAYAGPRRVWLWLAKAAPETAPVYGPALAYLNAEAHRLAAPDPTQLIAGRARILWRRHIAAAEARVERRGTFQRGNEWGRRFAREVARLLDLPEVRARLLSRPRPFRQDFDAVVREHAHWSLTPEQRGRLAGFLFAACYGWRRVGPEWERRFGEPTPQPLRELGERCSAEVPA